MDRIAWGMSIIGAFVLFLMLVVTIADVVADKLLKLPFPGATELVMSIMPISVCAFLLSLRSKNATSSSISWSICSDPKPGYFCSC
jgi:hypothetical protein